jgi:hypothetical protein
MGGGGDLVGIFAALKNKSMFFCNFGIYMNVL